MPDSTRKAAAGLVLAFTVVLFGCASYEDRKADFVARMHAWVGRPVAELERARGYPTKVLDLSDGRKVYVYERSVSGTRPVTTSESTDYFGNKTTEVHGGGSYHYWCTLYFETRSDGIIATVRAEGNNCF